MLPNRRERRIRIQVAYDGTEYHGWQVQPGLPTIQGMLERVAGEIEERSVTVHGSGRTDAGVHAEAQVAAFTLTNPIPAENLRRAMNRLLPPAIRVQSVEEVPMSFHPRFDAFSKTYEYRLHRNEICPPSLRLYVQHHPYPLDVERMRAAAALFEGEHDFSAFAASDDRDGDGRSKVRRIFSSQLLERGEVLVYRVRGSGFLKHMVRNVVGMLLETGKGNLKLEGLRALLDAEGGGKCTHSAPAKGLHLLEVEYRDVRGSF